MTHSTTTPLPAGGHLRTATRNVLSLVAALLALAGTTLASVSPAHASEIVYPLIKPAWVNEGGSAAFIVELKHSDGSPPDSSGTAYVSTDWTPNPDYPVSFRELHYTPSRHVFIVGLPTTDDQLTEGNEPLPFTVVGTNIATTGGSVLILDNDPVGFSVVANGTSLEVVRSGPISTPITVFLSTGPNDKKALTFQPNGPTHQVAAGVGCDGLTVTGVLTPQYRWVPGTPATPTRPAQPGYYTPTSRIVGNTATSGFCIT